MTATIHRWQLYRDGLEAHRAAEGYAAEPPMPKFGGPPLLSLGLTVAVGDVLLEYAEECDGP